MKDAHVDADLNDRVIVQVLDSLGRNRGGLTRAVFDRFRAVSEGRRAILVTVAFQSNVERLFEELKKDGSLPAHAELVSFHQDLRRRSRDSSQKMVFEHTEWESNPAFQSVYEGAATWSLRRYFASGAFVGLVGRAANGQLTYVERHQNERPWLRVYRDTSWPGGSIANRDYFDDHGVVRFRTYIGVDECPYLSTWVNPAGYEYRTVEHTSGDPILHRDMRWANSAWLAEKLKEFGPAVVFSDEPRTSFALAISSPDVFHVASIHTTHYKNNRDSTDGLKQWMKHHLEFIDNVGLFVFFTETQRRDFIADTGCRPEATMVVPHAAPVDVGLALQGIVKRVDQQFVTVSRLADDKQIDQAIRAFVKVHREYPEARYKIFGIGPAVSSLRQVIAECNLEGVVTLEGHTEDPLSQFASADCSILTSRYEGFGLVLTESFACGTPVISYDVVYGPRDVVQHEYNGLLVPYGDTEGLAASILKYLRDAELRVTLRAGAASTALRFDPVVWKQGWMSTVAVALGVA
ncbi:glycosyltransferase [Pseudarthrobacter enclensis]|uniref:glycosyltransferase n=1 Tax=Pseudarthrobacter enclensis TaxID=993070 RepID=UPI0034222ABD